MNQAVFVEYNITVQLYVKRWLKLTISSTIISSYLVKFIKHNKSSTAFLDEIVIIFSPFCLPGTTYIISSTNIRIEL